MLQRCKPFSGDHRLSWTEAQYPIFKHVIIQHSKETLSMPLCQVQERHIESVSPKYRRRSSSHPDTACHRDPFNPIASISLKIKPLYRKLSVPSCNSPPLMTVRMHPSGCVRCMRLHWKLPCTTGCSARASNCVSQWCEIVILKGFATNLLSYVTSKLLHDDLIDLKFPPG